MTSPNTRRHERVELINDVYFEQGQEEVAARWSDICSIGVFVQTQDPLPTGKQVKLWLRLEPDGKLYRAVGVVRHNLKWVGMGVEFTHLHPTAKSSIEQLAAMRI
ncbi:MAG: PilZ domain-containing protein [Acidobacteria bacterium]|nr:PilZ domain-containing protein [Acidobacteriota bacterium]